MGNKRFSPLFFALLIIPYGIVFRYYFYKDSNFRILGVFTEVFHQLFLATCLLIFIGIIYLSYSKPKQADVQNVKMVYAWGSSSFLFLFCVFLVVFYVNPHARFRSIRYPSITPNARTIKIELYKKMETPPEMLIMGSSRAFTISPRYLNNKFNVNAFNMSVEGGSAIDYSIQFKYILNSEVASQIPQVMIVEISQGSFEEQSHNLDLQPLSLLPYMPPNLAILVSINSLQDAFGLQSFSDSVFILSLPSVKNRFRGWSFEKDGWGIRKPVSYEQYEKMLQTMTDDLLRLGACTDINPTAREIFESTLAVAKENNVAIVLYESPMHVELYNALYQNDPEGYKFCDDLYLTYLSSLAESYPNVFYRDLSEYELVNNLAEDGFYDGIHLRPNASELVIDALMPEIESAIAWSIRQELEISP